MSCAYLLTMAAIVDRRQRELVALLHEAGAEPLTFRDLEARGIHHPAQLIYELELAGEPIERVYRRNPSGVRAAAGFRLAPDRRR
jgi:hypothetical protein